MTFKLLDSFKNNKQMFQNDSPIASAHLPQDLKSFQSFVFSI